MSSIVKSIKPATSYEEQVKIYINRNMIVNDIKKAQTILSEINYYRFSGYTYLFRDGFDSFNNCISFEKIYDIYCLDEELRNIVIYYISKIEINIKTRIAHELARKYDPLMYLNNKYFFNKDKHNEFIKIVNNQISKRKSFLFVEHHNNFYGGKFPIWVIVEILTLGNISKLYNNLLTADKKLISSKYYSINQKDVLASWLRVITEVRNLCAHNDRLYKSKLISSPKNTGKYKFKYDIFSSLYVIYILLQGDNLKIDFIYDLFRLKKKYKSINFNIGYGFPKNWLERMLIDLKYSFLKFKIQAIKRKIKY